jgi:hypothetical protein
MKRALAAATELALLALILAELALFSAMFAIVAKSTGAV